MADYHLHSQPNQQPKHIMSPINSNISIESYQSLITTKISALITLSLTQSNPLSLTASAHSTLNTCLTSFIQNIASKASSIAQDANRGPNKVNIFDVISALSSITDETGEDFSIEGLHKFAFGFGGKSDNEFENEDGQKQVEGWNVPFPDHIPTFPTKQVDDGSSIIVNCDSMPPQWGGVNHNSKTNSKTSSKTSSKSKSNDKKSSTSKSKSKSKHTVSSKTKLNIPTSNHATNNKTSVNQVPSYLPSFPNDGSRLLIANTQQQQEQEHNNDESSDKIETPKTHFNPEQIRKCLVDIGAKMEAVRATRGGHGDEEDSANNTFGKRKR